MISISLTLSFLGLTALLLVLIVSCRDYIWGDFRSIQKLQREGRVIDAATALRLHELGQGRIIINQGSLPCKWWYLDNKDTTNDQPKIITVSYFGKAILCDSRATEHLLEAYGNQFETITDSFID